MKNKIIILMALAATTIGLASVVTTTVNSSTKDLLASTLDFENENEGIQKVNVRKAATNSKLKMSKIYVQTAHNTADGYDYLRFATSVKGSYSNISYTRQVEGKADETQNVTSVYKGISANGETTYSNGSDLRSAMYTSTDGCYWACYTIKFTTETYKSKDITVTINVDGQEQTRTVNFSNLNKQYTYLGDAIKDNSELQSLQIEKARFALDSKNVATPHEDFSNAELGLARSNGFMFGLTTDGKDIYYAMTFGGSSDTQASFKLMKYDTTTKESSYITTGNTGSGDFKNLIYDDGILYMLGGGTQLEQYGWKLGGSWANGAKYNFVNTLNGAAAIVNGVARNPTTGKYVVLSKDSAGKEIFRFYDKDKNYLTDEEKELSIDFTGGFNAKAITTKSLQVDDKYIYVSYKQDNFKGIRLGVYDWDGNLVRNFEYTNSSIYNYGTTDFSNGSFCILNNKIYFSTVAGWGASGGANSELYSLDFSIKSTQTTQEKTIYEKIADSNYYDEAYTFEDVSYPSSVMSSNSLSEIFFQGATTDGKYIYYLHATGQCTTGRIVKYNPILNKILSITKPFTLREVGEWNDCGSLFYYNGRVYAIGVGAVYSVATEDLTTSASITVEVEKDTTLPWIPATTKNSYMAYSEKENVFYFQNNGKLYKYSSEGQLLGESSSTCTLGEHQGLTLIDGRVHVIGSANSSYNITTDETTTRHLYDAVVTREVYEDLTFGPQFSIGSQENPIGGTYTKDTGRCSNIQNLIDYNGTLYAGRLIHSAGSQFANGPYIFKANFNEEKLANIDSTMLFGEKIENPSFAENYEMRHLNGSYGGNYIQGLATVGDTFYITNSSNKAAYISKYNPTLNTFTKSTKQVELGNDQSGNAGRIFHYDNSLWIINQSGVAIGVDLNTLEENNKTLEFTLPSGGIPSDIKYIEETGGFAILDTKNNLHYLNENREVIKTVSGIQTPGSGRAIKTISVSGAYVYVVSSKDNEAGFGLNVYDLKGNEVKSLAILGSTLGGSSANISCVADYKGKLLVSVLTWGGNAKAGIHTIDVK